MAFKDVKKISSWLVV